MKVFEKNLGSYLLLELSQNTNNELSLTLYKKWSKGGGYESTDKTVLFTKEQREKAIIIFNTINLKNVYKEMEILEREEN